MKTALSLQTGELVALVREGRIAAFVDRAATLPAADIADVLLELGVPERATLVSQLPDRLAARALLGLPRDARPERILASFEAAHAARLLAELGDDDAASLLGRMVPDRRRTVLDALAGAASLEMLLAHAGGSAGGLMTSRVVAVNELDSLRLAVEAVRRQAEMIGDLTEVFVVDAERRLRGSLPLSELLLAAPSLQARDVMTRHVVHVRPEEDGPLVARVIARYGLTSVPVVDRGGRLMGRVTAEAVREIAVDEATDDLLRFGGVSGGEALDGGWSAVVRSRLPWLYTNLLPAFGAAAVVYFFRGSLLRTVTLAVWMPVVAGVGGNAGTQALATSVRRLALHPGRPARLRALARREAAAGIASGAGIGGVVGCVAVLLGESWKLGLVVALAMAANVALAAGVGAALPIVLKRFGRDTTLASPVMVTAVTDATGFALLLGLATAILLR